MNTTHTSFVLASLLALSTGLLAGCGTYRVVKLTPNGGELALVGSPEKAREKANEYMSSRCPQGYAILEEGEAVVGSETKAETTRSKTLFGQPSQNTTAETTDKREWRIKYQCKDAAGATPGAPAADAAPQKQGAIHELVIRY